MRKVIAFDTETRGLDWFNPSQQAFLVSWADDKGEYHAPILPDGEIEGSAFRLALEAADIIVCHNLSFDAHQLRATTGIDILTLNAELEDTDLMSRVLLPSGQRPGERGGHGLKTLAMKYLHAEAGDAEAKIKDLADKIGANLKAPGGYYDTWRAFPEQLEHYAKMDARYTYDLYVQFNNKLEKSPELQKVYAMERKVAPILITAEATGVALDQDAVKRLSFEYDAKEEAARTQAIKGGIPEAALRGQGSEAKLRDALVDELGIPLYRKTASGQLKTDQFALNEFADNYPVINDFQEWRTSAKFLSTYIEPMVGRSVVHPSFRQIGAWTGRMSCARPNMQNIPKRAGKEVRSMFVPRPDHAFVVADYKSIEVRLLAYYLNDPGYISLIEDGHDPHAYMAAQIHGGLPEDWEGTPERDVAKNTLFAIIYGAGAPRVSDMNGIPKDAAKALISKITGSLPKYYKLKQRVSRKVQNTGYVTTLMGRENHVKRDKAYVGLNALIQGSAADIMKQGLVNVAEQVNGQVLLVVHDEVVIEVPMEGRKAALEITKGALRRAAPADFRPGLDVEGSIVTTNYSEA